VFRESIIACSFSLVMDCLFVWQISANSVCVSEVMMMTKRNKGRRRRKERVSERVSKVS
jgi:hypothetical protein